MTKERKIEILKDLLIQLSDSANILCTCEADERCEVIEECIEALEQQPSDCVSLGVYNQVAWERDIAIEQLKELGYELGEKIRTSEDCVSRKAVDKLCFRFLKPYNDDNMAFYEHFCDLPSISPTHGTCKDCKHRDPEDKKCDCGHTIVWQTPRPDNWYCADFKERGNEDD